MTTNPTNTPRVFKIGAQRIVEDASTSHLSNEEIRTLLKSSYPEIAHATIRERVETTDSGDLHVIEFMNQVGRKG